MSRRYLLNTPRNLPAKFQVNPSYFDQVLTRSSLVRAAISGQRRAFGGKRGASGNLQTTEPSGENAEPPHLYAENLCLGSPSARVEICVLH
jgi:hypothetical protein